MWQKLDLWDGWLFLKINTVWTNSLLDSVYPWYRDETMWIPLYLFLVLFVAFNFGMKALPWIVCVVVCLTLSDQLSSHVLKPLFARPRPCANPLMSHYARLLIGYCPGNASFTSSHAANHFATGLFFFLTLKPYIKKYAYFFLFIAASVSYGQVYIGVHYPLDVLGGALAGCIIGAAIAYIFNTRIKLTTIK